jgi:succinate dehydrogenase/fumarate reductase flavoprotein subunit
MERNSKTLLPMVTEKILLNNFTVDYYRVNTLIIGSGVASLNAAVTLHSMGKDDLLVATSEFGGGTSNNAGSDKQTYYKLSLSGSHPDSVLDMAQDLFNGRCMHGDIALCEAQGSVQAFINLVNLGVRFPHDKYGSWPGYKTDNDPRSRATSVGPYTSRRMFEALGTEVRKRNITVLDNHHCITLLTDKSGSEVIGALAINTAEKDFTKAFVLFNSTNVILGTGGPGGLYDRSVYPVSQSGSIGIAFKAGATGQNLTESQFGIASLKLRWNLSGSYQQAIPRYISTDNDGHNEREFLNEYFPDLKTLTKAVFLKGYQWPFDPCKVENYGSSLIDLLVHKEINDKERKVFIDFSSNPSLGADSFTLDTLDSEVYNYLKQSDALRSTPVERLQSMNPLAAALYKEHGIDLQQEPVQIAVCAQHNNGGLKSNIWWESDLRHLFPVGEVNGSHGVYRPGGAALNSGQVGSFRAAQFISKKYNKLPMDDKEFLNITKNSTENALTLARGWIKKGSGSENRKCLSEIRMRMSESGGIIRDKLLVSDSVLEAADLLDRLPDKLGADSVPALVDAFLLMDHCLTHYIYLCAINKYIEMGGRSRGSYLITGSGSKGELLPESDICVWDRDVENKILEVGFRNGIVNFNLSSIREIPSQDLWFEKVWKDYIEDIYLES